METQRFMLAENIEVEDKINIGNIWYKVFLAVTRNVHGVPKFRQITLEVDGARGTEDTTIMIVFPLGALVKVKTARKTQPITKTPTERNPDGN